MGRRIAGRFQATDDVNLDGHHIVGMTFLEDLPRGGAEVGQVMVWMGDSWGPTTLTGDGGSYVVTWGDVLGKPEAFTPSAHTHTVADVTDFPTTWAWANLTGVPDLVNDLSAGTGISLSTSTGSVTVTCDLTWSELADKPTSFNPSTHTHTVADVTNFPTTWAWTDLTGVPDLVNTISTSGALSASTSTGSVTLTNTMTWGTLPNKPTEFTPADHTHVVTDITDFPTTWAWTDLTGVPSLVNSVTAGTGINVSSTTGNVTITNSMTWGTLPNKPTFVNSVSAGTNVNISTSTGDVVISVPSVTTGITAITAGTNISVNGSTVSVVDAPTFAGTVTAAQLDSNGDVNAAVDLTAGFDAELGRNLYLNFGGPDGDSYLYFYEGGSATGSSISWDDSAGEFYFNKNVRVGGLFDCDSNVSGSNIIADDELRAGGDVHINNDGPDGNSYLYFYNGGSRFGESLQWLDADDRFALTDTLNLKGSLLCEANVFVNWGGPDADSGMYFHDGGNDAGASILWDTSVNRFVTSHAAEIGGNILCEGNLVYINYAGPDGNAALCFYQNSAINGARLDWNDSDATFEFTHPLYVNGRVRIAGGNNPSTSTASGSPGEIAWDSTYLYVCVGPNSWKRVALSSF